MAYNESGKLTLRDSYDLGNYAFEVYSIHGTNEHYVQARCTNLSDNSTAAQNKTIGENDVVSGWYVDANDTTADVYAVVKTPTEGPISKRTSDLDTELSKPIPSSSPVFSGSFVRESDGSLYTVDSVVALGDPVCVNVVQPFGRKTVFLASKTSAKIEITTKWEYEGREITQKTSCYTNKSYTYKGKTVHYNDNVANSAWIYYDSNFSPNVATVVVDPMFWGSGPDAWTMVYGIPVDPEYEEKTILVGRFAIDPGNADVGDWDDPGDYNPDPTKTLHLTVTGALSGRHNDPLNDSADFSYVPADQNSIPNWGCGGDGGHGGGGGAGASTVIINRFATSKANAKELIALAKRHGYGSGGGKGGTGGKGCILIYY